MSDSTLTTGIVGGRSEAIARMADQGCSPPRGWRNGPGDRYDWHAHTHHKVLFCLSGSITFHTREGDIEMSAGDGLDLAPGTEHAATVGRQGVECIEAFR